MPDHLGRLVDRLAKWWMSRRYRACMSSQYRQPDPPPGIPALYCSEQNRHQGDHVARGAGGRVLARWPE